MRIILARPRGFCAGVNMAIQSLEAALARFGSPLYVYHEIVHNTWVVEDFRARGVVFVDSIDDVPQGAHVLFSAHGVSPQIRWRAAARRLQAIDATCPLVTKVHREAIRFAEDGYRIILIGHEGHDEVVGTMGEAPQQIRLISRIEDVDRLDIPPEHERIAYLTQTTLSVVEAEHIVEALRARYPQIVGPAQGDICFATQHRQEAVRRLARQADVVLVVGSANSSNSRRLAELAAAEGVPSHLVDGPDDIDLAWLGPSHTLVVTAGASAPESIVEQCVQRIRQAFDATVENQGIDERPLRFALPAALRD